MQDRRSPVLLLSDGDRASLENRCAVKLTWIDLRASSRAGFALDKKAPGMISPSRRRGRRAAVEQGESTGDEPADLF
jgi:hypothetical protein